MLTSVSIFSTRPPNSLRFDNSSRNTFSPPVLLLKPSHAPSEARPPWQRTDSWPKSRPPKESRSFEMRCGCGRSTGNAPASALPSASGLFPYLAGHYVHWETHFARLPSPASRRSAGPRSAVRRSGLTPASPTSRRPYRPCRPCRPCRRPCRRRGRQGRRHRRRRRRHL